MTKSHLAHLAAKGLLVLLAGLPLASRAGGPLILVCLLYTSDAADE